MCRLRWSAALLVLICASPAAAQQGALLLSATTQVLTGDELRLAGQNRLEPDLAVSWVQPAFRLGTFELNTHLIQRDDQLRLGATVLGLRDVRVKGLSWSLLGGDAWVTPSITDYTFTNLFAPRLNLAGAVAQGQSQQTSITIGVGKSTALRNIFGTDTDVLDQGVAFVKVRHRPSQAFEFSLRGSGVRTRDLGEFSWSIAESRQAGGGIRYRPIGLIEFVGDAAYTSFRRRGVDAYEQDVSALAGTFWALPGGWVQVNAQRLSPGEFPVLHNSLTDRQGVFAAGEYDATRRLRVFGGIDGFLTNLEPEASAQGIAAPPRTRFVRAFGGVRTLVTQRSFLTLRVEDGSRESRPVPLGRASEADLSLVAAEWQATFGRWNTFARYARRSNVDLISSANSFVQHDTTGQVYFSPSRSAQLFGSVQLQRRDSTGIAGLNYWQVSAGGQLQVPSRNLWLRAEGTATSTQDLTTDFLTERQALTVGFFGQITNRTQIAFDLYVDRAPNALVSSNPYTTRSTIRLVHSIPTGSARVAPAGATTVGRTAPRGTGAVTGLVFADWNGNGTRDPGDEPLGGIALAVGSLASVTSGADGQFRFAQVPVGLQQVGLDVTALPVDYDVPLVARVEVDIERNKTAQVSFGLVPLGSVVGGVYRDANADGHLDEGDEPIDGAIVVMDEGARSELARGGSFKFDAVRAGRHVVRLLTDSLPSGAEIQGPAETAVELTRGSMAAHLAFLVKLEKRPEIRKVFPSTTVAATPPRPGPPAPPPPRPVVPAPVPARPAPLTPPTGASRSVTAALGPVSIQLAAVGRLERALSLVEDLRSRGFDPYVVQPAPGGADEFYRVRIGAYASREVAQQAIAVLRDALELPAVVTAEQPPTGVPFRIQVAAVREADQARRLVQRLSQAGYPAYVIGPGPGASDLLYRVRVGTYGTREEARGAADAIEKELGSRVWVTQDQTPPGPPGARRVPGGAVAAPAKPAAGLFVLQVAAFADEARAQSVAARIKELGLSPLIVPPQPGGADTLFRVRVGGFTTRDAAASAAEQLERAFGTKPWILPTQQAGGAAPVAPLPSTPPLPPPVSGPFVVQVGAMADPDRARALADRLGEMGYQAYVRGPSPDSPDTLQRVGVGPFATLDEARAAAAAIEAALGLKGWVRPATAR